MKTTNTLLGIIAAILVIYAIIDFSNWNYENSLKRSEEILKLHVKQHYSGICYQDSISYDSLMRRDDILYDSLMRVDSILSIKLNK